MKFSFGQSGLVFVHIALRPYRGVRVMDPEFRDLLELYCTALALGCTCWKKDLTGTNKNSRNLMKQRETTGDSCKKMDVASTDDSLTQIGKYFAILIFADSY